MRYHPACACLALTASLAAQGRVPPPILTERDPVPGLTSAALPGFNPRQISMVQLPGDPTGTYLTALTFSSLPAASGGVGGEDLMTGKYDILTDTFTPDLNAAGLNTGGNDFGLSLHHTGLIAVFDRPPGSPYVATRPDTSSPFVLQGAITNLQSRLFYDPAVADVNGQLHLVYTVNQTLAMAPLDLTTLAIGTPTTIAVGTEGRTPNSSSPILDASNNMVGVSYHDLTGNFIDNDHYVAFDLDRRTPGMLLKNTPDFLTNSTHVGGTFFDARGSVNFRIVALDTVWCTGGRGPVGGSMSVVAKAPPSNAAGNFSSFLVLSAAFITPVSVPSFTGQLGVDPASLLGTPIGLHAAPSGQVQISFSIPNVGSLSGAVVPAQMVTADTARAQLIFGNTCALTIE